MAVNGADGAVGKVGVTLSAGHEEAEADIFFGFAEGKGREVVVNEDALAELAEGIVTEFRFQFGLSDEEDLEEFAGIGFEVGEEADMFEGLERHILGFVDDEDNFAALADQEEEEFIELIEKILAGTGWFGNAQFAKDGLKELGIGEFWIEDECGGDGLGFQLGEQLAAEGGFAAADLTGKDDEALFFANAVTEVLHGFLVTGREVEEARIWGNVERAAGEPEEGFVHDLTLGAADGGSGGGRQRKVALPWRSHQ